MILDPSLKKHAMELHNLPPPLPAPPGPVASAKPGPVSLTIAAPKLKRSAASNHSQTAKKQKTKPPSKTAYDR